MRRSVAAFVLALSLVFASVAQAAPTTWTIDPNHSQVGFSIRHFFSKVPGSFTKYSGTIRSEEHTSELSHRLTSRMPSSA